MSVQIRIQKEAFKITFKYDTIIHEHVKALPGAKYKVAFIKGKKEPFWTVPIEYLAEVQKFSADHNAFWIKTRQVIDVVENPNVPDVPPMSEDAIFIEIPDYIYSRSRKESGDPYQLMDYQIHGIQRGFVLKKFLNGDQPGLGKTIQTIATIELEKIDRSENFATFIICPATLKLNWKDEIQDWTGKEAMILSDKNKNDWYHYHHQAGIEYFILNYESQSKYFVESIDKTGKPLMLADINYKNCVDLAKAVVLDEAHKLKDHTTQAAKFAFGICKDKDMVIPLTGTPVVNKPRDLMSILAMMGKLHLFGNSAGFAAQYCSGKKEASNLKELNYLLNKYCFFRRQKDDVLKELPPKTRQVVKLEISNREEYEVAENNLVKYLEDYRQATEPEIMRALRGKIMVQIGICKDVSARGKIKDAVEWIRDTLSEGEKVVLFIHQHKVCDELKLHFPGAALITGQENESQRDFHKKRFQSDPKCQLIICSIGAGGVGITLTASCHVVLLEIPWTFKDCEQIEDRVHRKGQKKNVLCTYLLGNNTYDETNYRIIMDKKEIHNQVTGTDDRVEENVVHATIDMFNNGKIKL